MPVEAPPAAAPTRRTMRFSARFAPIHPSQAFQKVRNLLPYMKKLPNKRVVRLDGLASDPLKFRCGDVT